MTITVSTDISLIGHLMRRAAFGAPASELEALAGQGYDAIVNDLLHSERHPRLEEDLLERYHSEHAGDLSYQWTSSRWLYRMINTARPLEEKVALMWHGTFATGASKVINPPSMNAHYEMLRDYGLGNFRVLLQKLSRDPAMLFWLDQQTNHSAAVNENYGRELLELFSMGRGNYTEDDVRACARAFTGWTLDQVIPRYPHGYYPPRFVYREEDHDHGLKTFLGKTGDWNGDDIIDMIVEQPATASFVARKVFGFFVSDEPDNAVISDISRSFQQSGYEIRPVLGHLFRSDAFKKARFKRVKSPAEFVAGTERLAGAHREAHQFGLDGLSEATGLMGQQLLNPPTVEGWHTGREWIDSSFLVQRVNFASDRLGNPANPGIASVIERIASDRTTINPDDLIEACLYEMGALEAMDATKQAIKSELELAAPLDCSQHGRQEFTGITADVLRLIASSREFQLA
ncbi:MAG: DUF1800 domain-containing protein [Chloroflexi bacterium]|nr:DUF1800 domain-containing protein [Chloroflexota bacterium]